MKHGYQSITSKRNGVAGEPYLGEKGMVLHLNYSKERSF
jgi:hypothetical protein